MAEKMTQICCADGRSGHGAYGAHSREYMIKALRDHAKWCMARAKRIMETKDEDFIVYQCDGVHVERNKKFILHGGKVLSGYTTCPECGKTLFKHYMNEDIGIFQACGDASCRANWADTRKRLLDAQKAKNEAQP